MRLAFLLLFTTAAYAVDLLAVVGVNKPYLDEQSGLVAGLSARFPLTRRLAIRPEALWSSIPSYKHTFGLAGVTYDFTEPDRPAVGYVTGGGGGVVRLNERDFFTSSDPAWYGGIGVRFRLPGQWVSSAEFRTGLDAIPMATFRFGYTWRR